MQRSMTNILDDARAVNILRAASKHKYYVVVNIEYDSRTYSPLAGSRIWSQVEKVNKSRMKLLDDF